MGGGWATWHDDEAPEFPRVFVTNCAKTTLFSKKCKTTHPVFMMNLPAYYFCSLAVCMFPLVLRHSSVSSFCAPADIKHFATSRSSASLVWTGSVDPKRPQVSLNSHRQIQFISTEMPRFSSWINILEVQYILYIYIYMYHVYDKYISTSMYLYIYIYTYGYNRYTVYVFLYHA